MNISKFILSVLFSLVSCSAFAQNDAFELVLPIESVVYDSIDVDCLENDSTFNFKITSKITKQYNLEFIVARGRRVVTRVSKSIEVLQNVPTYFSVVLPKCAWGDKIVIEEKQSSFPSYIIEVYPSYENEYYDNTKGYQYPSVLTFESQLYENTNQIEWKEGLVNHVRETSDSTINYCDVDSLYTKKLNDSSYFINSKVEKVEYILNEDIDDYWKKNDEQYIVRWSWRLGVKDDSLFFDEFYNQNILIVRGKMNKETFKNLKKEYKKEIKSNRINTNFYREKPYLIVLDFKDIDWNNESKWLYYSIVWKKTGVLVILTTNSPFINYFHYYKN